MLAILFFSLPFFNVSWLQAIEFGSEETKRDRSLFSKCFFSGLKVRSSLDAITKTPSRTPLLADYLNTGSSEKILNMWNIPCNILMQLVDLSRWLWM